MKLTLSERIERHTTILPNKINIGVWSHARPVCLGYVGEIVAKLLFEYNNYEVWHTGDNDNYDILANNIRIEVKTARRYKNSARYRYQFCLNRVNHCDINHADYVLLLAIIEHGNIVAYLIPTDIVTSNKTLKINPYSKRSKYNQYIIQDYSNITL